MRMKIPGWLLAIGVLTHLTSGAMARTARQWEPIEWQFENRALDGNPFDQVAKAEFQHEDGKHRITTELYYAGGNTWVLRFTGTTPGKWSFTTRSSDPDLDGHRGDVTIEANPGAPGFLTAYGNKWGRLGLDEAFVPQIVSYAAPMDYYQKPEKIDADLRTWFGQHGFNGLHTFVGMAWFDLDQGRSGYKEIASNDPNPDPRTFQALELLITKTHRAGGMVHIWAWGDEQRNMTTVRWGLNGKVDQRLQRYICARLGPLPGWSMGYGFDLQEWVNRGQLATWHRFMHDHLGWSHFLGARAPDLEQIFDGLDYSSYQQLRPTYDTYVEAIERRHPGKPSFLEDRFRVRINVYPEKDYDLDMTRRGLWHSTMAGGVANIWAYLIDAPKDGSSAIYPNREQILTYSRFWRGRFFKEMVRNNARTDGVCLEVPGAFCVCYREDTDSIQMNLAGLKAPLRAFAVDTRAAYREIPLADLEPSPGQLFRGAHRSDWAIAVGRTQYVSLPATAPTPLTKPSFTDITGEGGTGGPEGRDTGGHGVAFADVTGSGFPDLYISMNGSRPMPDLFFRNVQTRFANEGVERGLCSRGDGGTHGFCFADLDNDVAYDAFRGITYAPGTVRPGGANQVKRNDGRGFFTDATPPALQARAEATRAVLAFDRNRNGRLDLFAVSGPWGSDDPPDERNEAYLNRGGFAFSPVDSEILHTVPAGQGAIDTDLDGDGDIDVLAANRTGEVHILRNDGNGGFERVPPRSLGITHQAQDGITAADVNNDGHLDLLLAGDDYGELYLNQGDGTFRHHQGFRGTDGYMGGFADLNHDGHLDLVFAGDARCYLNDGTGRFAPGPAIPVAGIDDPRAVAFADIDGDGDLDFAVAAKRSRNFLIRNDLNGGNWLKVKLIAPQGQAGAFGARTRIYPAGQAGGSLLGLRESRSNHGYLAQDDPVLHFGLGNHLSVDVVVRFLDGTVATQRQVRAGRTLLVDGRVSQAAAVVPADPLTTSPVRPREPLMTRRGLWHLTLAGGIGNIWAYLVPTADEGGSRPYPNREQMQTHARFF